ncbi:hypothetical protein O3P69_019226 [Scylla paramamosain]|uniref:Uncharacterized protein n=1 Tax=Scylla paramamosain TaxID=85552 RepID=A0AAW0SW97_SCYPA
MNDVELREILSELLPHVRMDHVLPPNHDILTQAIKRGLVSTPPSHMIGDDTTNYRVNAWIRSKNNGLFVKPRLFTPYAEEIKSVVDEQTAGGVDVIRLQCFVSHIPDALYMVEDNAPHQPPTYTHPAPTTVDVVAAAIPEFNLPDSVADMLEGASYTEEEDEEEMQQRCSVRDEGRSKLQPPEFLLDPLLEPPPHHYRMMQGDEGHLSEVMPDVALASSSLSALHLEEQRLGSLEGLEGTQMTLDLGDGSHHQVGSHLTLGGSHGRRSSRRRRLPPHLTPPPAMSGHHTYGGGGGPHSPHTPPLRPHTTTGGSAPRHHPSPTPPLFL